MATSGRPGQGSRVLDSGLESDTGSLRDLGQVTLPLWAALPLSLSRASWKWREAWTTSLSLSLSLFFFFLVFFSFYALAAYGGSQARGPI